MQLQPMQVEQLQVWLNRLGQILGAMLLFTILLDKLVLLGDVLLPSKRGIF